MNQGEIWDVNLNQTKGSEQSGYRPVVIISGNLLNKYLKVVITCPLTTNIKNYKGNVVLSPNIENGLEESSEVLIFHIRSISKDRFQKKVGCITNEELDSLKIGVNDILNY